MTWIYSLRWKLLVTYMVVSFFPFMFFAITSYENIKANHIKTRQESILVHIDDIHKNKENDEYIKEKEQLLNSEIYILENEGSTLKLMENEYNLLKIKREVDDDFIVVISSIKNMNKNLNEIKNKLYIYTLVNSIIVGVLSFVVSGIIIKPLKKILKVIKLMTAGHLDQKIPIEGRDEIGELSKAFNDMSDKLKQVDSTRQEFVSNVSHELKTPLSSVKVLTESLLLQEEFDEEMVKEILGDINSEIDRLNEIIEDLLMMVKLERTESAVTKKSTYINRLIEDIIKRLKPIAEKKEIEIIYNTEKEVTADVDEVKFTLAISNLIENAIKYNYDNGFVKINLDSDHQNAYITIQDDGIGISAEEQNKIFERFYRVDKVRDRETGGTGLGLAITYKTILQHNGHIKVDSEVDKGSTFMVRIPLKENE